MKPLLACLSLALLPAGVLLAARADQPQQAAPSPKNAQIDYAKFVDLAKKVQPYREKRRVTEQQFLKLSQRNGSVILDTRSERAFREAHLQGAVHLNFSDINKESLLETLGEDKNRLVLIYCNNNFPTQTPAFPTKRVEAALNIPTFVTLYAYGYSNLYELGPVIDPQASVLELVHGGQQTGG